MTPWRKTSLPVPACKTNLAGSTASRALWAVTTSVAGVNAACWLVAWATGSFFGPLVAVASIVGLAPIAAILLLAAKLTAPKREAFTWRAFGLALAIMALVAFLNLWVLGQISAAV